MSLKEFIIIHNQTSFIRVATNRRVKFTWSKESYRACLKSKIENFMFDVTHFKRNPKLL